MCGSRADGGPAGEGTRKETQDVNTTSDLGAEDWRHWGGSRNGPNDRDVGCLRAGAVGGAVLEEDPGASVEAGGQDSCHLKIRVKVREAAGVKTWSPHGQG